MTKLTYGFAALLLALCTPPLEAAVITYTYTGNDYTTAVSPYTAKMAVTGSFTFASPLAPNTLFPATESPATWSISDGVETINNTSGTLFFDVGTDSSGNITSWDFGTEFPVSTGELIIASENVPSQGPPPSFPCGSNVCDAVFGVAAGHAVGLAAVINNPGTWTSTAPEPSSVFLMTVGMLAMAYVARNRAVRLTGISISMSERPVENVPIPVEGRSLGV